MTTEGADQARAGGPASIPNFAWVDRRLLARGRQPPLTPAAYAELRDCGIAAVLSLRLEREYPDDERRRYDVAEERSICESLGLAFHHVRCSDFQAPRPREVVRALAIIRQEVEEGRPIYVHCLAGVGRTGVVSGAWQMLHGVSGTDALRSFADFCHDAWNRRTAQLPTGQPAAEPAIPLPPGWDPTDEQRTVEEYFLRIGAHYQGWVLLAIARALALPAEPPPNFVPLRRPANGANWGRRFREQVERHLGPLDRLIARGVEERNRRRAAVPAAD